MHVGVSTTGDVTCLLMRQQRGNGGGVGLINELRAPARPSGEAVAAAEVHL